MTEKEGMLRAEIAAYRHALDQIKSSLSPDTPISNQRYKEIYDQAIGIVIHGRELLCDESTLEESEKDTLGAYLQQEILPLILLTETTSRFYSKPLGYSGDYVAIDNMYHYKGGGKGRLGPLIDRIHLDAPTSVVVRNRRKLLADYLTDFVQQAAAKVHITCIACGPAREVFDMFERLPDPTKASVTLIDSDGEAVQFVNQLIQETGLSAQIQTIHESLPNLMTGRKKLNIPEQDLVYSIGVIDYFQDKYVIKLLNFIHSLLQIKGKILLGNFHKRNKFKEYMDYVLEWKLVHRNEEDMNNLFRQSAFHSIQNIFFEDMKYNMFVEAIKKQSADS